MVTILYSSALYLQWRQDSRVWHH